MQILLKKNISHVWCQVQNLYVFERRVKFWTCQNIWQTNPGTSFSHKEKTLRGATQHCTGLVNNESCVICVICEIHVINVCINSRTFTMNSLLKVILGPYRCWVLQGQSFKKLATADCCVGQDVGICFVRSVSLNEF